MEKMKYKDQGEDEASNGEEICKTVHQDQGDVAGSAVKSQWPLLRRDAMSIVNKIQRRMHQFKNISLMKKNVLASEAPENLERNNEERQQAQIESNSVSPLHLVQGVGNRNEDVVTDLEKRVENNASHYNKCRTEPI
ncbi:uncharacterized protein LOC112895036 [Panicum hallii]|uniref:uncharacterized protein LOC112895036 n=1 Tax=Panicum hallii TaxID=206008 RepID=UPI000DF4EB13|nr:uncharacterized protein LOC112895036 [Panicum hallii]